MFKPSIKVDGNFAKVEINADQSIAFSYETPIAFWSGGERWVRQNPASATTGKHLNQIDGGGKAVKDRLPPGEFLAAFALAFPSPKQLE